MSNVIISTETTSDLPKEYKINNNIASINMLYTIDDVDYGGNTERELDSAEFYKKMREGSSTHTTQITQEVAREHFVPLLEKSDVLHIAFSSALSGTAENLKLAAEKLNSEGRKHKVAVIDSLAASLGEGLLVHFVNEKAKTGVSLDELVSYAEEIKNHICHFFVVDDLNFLFRGGRVTKTAAVVGTMLKIKPVLHVDTLGRLVPIQKVVTRKKSLIRLVDWLVEKYDKNYNTVFITHGDCIEDAQYVINRLNDETNLMPMLVEQLGTVIGSHSGPGTVAIFFYGKDKLI